MFNWHADQNSPYSIGNKLSCSIYTVQAYHRSILNFCIRMFLSSGFLTSAHIYMVFYDDKTCYYRSLVYSIYFKGKNSWHLNTLVTNLKKAEDSVWTFHNLLCEFGGYTDYISQIGRKHKSNK